MKKLIIIFLTLILMGAGCKKSLDIKEKAVNACIELGGVPVLESHTSYTVPLIKDCKFKTE